MSVRDGSLHGGIGLKITGNNVVSIGLGSAEGIFGWNLGLQYPFKLLEMESLEFMNSPFVNISYGVIGTKWREHDGIETDKKTILGWSFMAGYLYGFGREKKIFVDMSIGYTYGKVKLWEGEPWEHEEKISSFTFDIGIGYRFNF